MEKTNELVTQTKIHIYFIRYFVHVTTFKRRTFY